METNKRPGGAAGAMAGKGLYLVLFLCAAVIGISAWIVAADMRDQAKLSETAENTVDISDAVVTMLPAGTPLEEDDSDTVPTIALSDEEETDEVSSEQTEETAEAPQTETAVTYVWPLRGEIEVPYSVETLLYDATMADWRTHDGIDIACALGDQVMAAASGTVVSVENSDLYGTVVELDHGNGVRSVYANLAEEPPVWEGEWVTVGQVIGSVGGTALAETNEVPHLHLAMTRDGACVDPRELLPEMETE